MKKVLIVCATYYSDITNSLKTQAELLLSECKIEHDNFEVPGVFEIPVVISKNLNNYDGFLALGCVIKGETPHFELITKATFDGLMNLSIESKKPIGNGIITALNKNQAFERQGMSVNKKSVNQGKGLEAAKAVIAVLHNATNK